MSLFPNLSELLPEEVFTRLQLFSELLLQQREVVAEDLSNLFSLQEGPDDSEQLAGRTKSKDVRLRPKTTSHVHDAS